MKHEKRVWLRRALAWGQAGVFNAAMKHRLFVAVALVLAGCVSLQPSESAGGFTLGHDLACDASEMRPDQGEPVALPISILAPTGGGTGRFCMATGCETAQFEPTSGRASGWTAIMRTNDRTNYNADLEIARDLRSFTLRQVDSDGASTWTGACSAAGS
jgi:hypothetical protein